MNLTARIARLEREAGPRLGECQVCARRMVWLLDDPDERPKCEACGKPMPEHEGKALMRADWEAL